MGCQKYHEVLSTVLDEQLAPPPTNLNEGDSPKAPWGRERLLLNLNLSPEFEGEMGVTCRKQVGTKVRLRLQDTKKKRLEANEY